MKPTHYELLEDKGRIILRAFSPDAIQGYWNVEIVKLNGGPGRLLPGLRKHAEHLAKAYGVPLLDRLTGGAGSPQRMSSLVKRKEEENGFSFSQVD